MKSAMLPETVNEVLRPTLRRLERLAPEPPQTILLEGGAERQRLECALYLAMAINCPTARARAAAGENAVPCLECATCGQIAANEYLDLFLYDGRISNREDEDNPGPARALSIENIRELKSRISASPHGAGKRIVIFQGLLLSSRASAMNSLLKNLEDPCGHTVFIMLAPQRGQILNTLVSRSFCLTLPWRDSRASDGEIASWEESLCVFLRNGSDFLEKIGGKGALDAISAQKIVLSCQRALERCLGGREDGNTKSALETCMKPLSANLRGAALLSRWIAETQEMLAGGVSPARALEAFSVKLYCLVREKSGKRQGQRMPED